jgi:hypothetical protein
MLIAVSHQGFFATCCGSQYRAFEYSFTSEELPKLPEPCQPKKTDSANSRLFKVKDKYFSGRKHTIEEIISDIKADQK